MRNTIILTVHNKEGSLSRILVALEATISDVTTKVLLVLDGCTDASKDIAIEFCKRTSLDTEIIETPDVWETLANNQGLQSVRTELVTIVQDDMFMLESHWDKKLSDVMQHHDASGVTGRSGCTVAFDQHGLFLPLDAIGRDHPFGHKTIMAKIVSRLLLMGTRFNVWQRLNFFPVIGRWRYPVRRQYINRGPLMLRMDHVEKLGFFDPEFAPFELDDADYCLRASKCLDAKFFVFPIGYVEVNGSKKTNELSSERSKMAIIKNSRLLKERHF